MFPTDSKNTEIRSYDLLAYHELRIEVEEYKSVSVSISGDGSAEIFGTELAPEREYRFTNTNFAVFTWHGCHITVNGKCKIAYTAEQNSAMKSYLNTHAVLENMRKEASENKCSGPRVMIVASKESGKSTLCRILLSYAFRVERTPMFVDLDVGNNDICIPGTVGATSINSTIEVETGIDAKNPIVYLYGSDSPADNVQLFKSCVSSLATCVLKRVETDEKENASGFIINTPSWVDGIGYELLLFAADQLKVDVFLVLGQDRLFAQLKSESSLKNCSIVKLEKSGGVVDNKDPRRRGELKMMKIRNYFRGPSNDLFPHQKVLGFNSFTVFRIVGGSQAPATALTRGREPDLDPTKPKLFKPNNELVHCVLGVSYSSDEEDLLSKNMAGFIHVTEVDNTKKQMTVLVPSPGTLPGSTFVMGKIKWFDK